MVKGPCKKCGTLDQGYIVQEESGPEVHCMVCGWVTPLGSTIIKPISIAEKGSFKRQYRGY